jgi:hypothetical protein
MDKRNIRSISDLNLIAYLICNGFKEVELPQREDKHVYFYFPDSPELQAKMKEFYLGHPTVDAQIYSYHLKRLRTIVSELHRGKGVK